METPKSTNTRISRFFGGKGRKKKCNLPALPVSSVIVKSSEEVSKEDRELQWLRQPDPAKCMYLSVSPNKRNSQVETRIKYKYPFLQTEDRTEDRSLLSNRRLKQVLSHPNFPLSNKSTESSSGIQRQHWKKHKIDLKSVENLLVQRKCPEECLYLRRSSRGPDEKTQKETNLRSGPRFVEKQIFRNAQINLESDEEKVEPDPTNNKQSVGVNTEETQVDNLVKDEIDKSIIEYLIEQSRSPCAEENGIDSLSKD